VTVSGRAPDPAAPAMPPADGMVWIPGATFTMGSDRHYPEEAPAHPVTVSGFWIDPGPVTNRDYGRFVRKTGHVTVAERPPDPGDYPGARPEMLVPFSAVLSRQGTGSAWPTVNRGLPSPAPTGSSPRAERSIRSSRPAVVHIAWADAVAWCQLGGQRTSRPRPSGSWPRAAGWTAPSSPGVTSSRVALDGQRLAGNSPSTTPKRAATRNFAGRRHRQRLRPLRHDRQRVGGRQAGCRHIAAHGCCTAPTRTAAQLPAPTGATVPASTGSLKGLTSVRGELLPPLPARRAWPRPSTPPPAIWLRLVRHTPGPV
jgi:formylglycine-generating enzyme required for sulfatase activity